MSDTMYVHREGRKKEEGRMWLATEYNICTHTLCKIIVIACVHYSINHTIWMLPVICATCDISDTCNIMVIYVLPVMMVIWRGVRVQ